VFYSGLIFLAFSVTGLRKKLVEAIPIELKLAITGRDRFLHRVYRFEEWWSGGGEPGDIRGLGRSVEAGAVASDCRDYRYRGSDHPQDPRRNHCGDFMLTVVGLIVPSPDGKGMLTAMPSGIVNLPAFGAYFP
jgi:hypothetical protein